MMKPLSKEKLKFIARRVKAGHASNKEAKHLLREVRRLRRIMEYLEYSYYCQLDNQDVWENHPELECPTCVIAQALSTGFKIPKRKKDE